MISKIMKIIDNIKSVFVKKENKDYLFFFDGIGPAIIISREFGISYVGFPGYKELWVNKASVDKITGTKKFLGLCPFHDEKTPSFIVYLPTKKHFMESTYHCVSCSAQGKISDLKDKCKILTFFENTGFTQ